MQWLRCFEHLLRLGHEWMESDEALGHNDAILWAMFERNFFWKLRWRRFGSRCPPLVDGDRRDPATWWQRRLLHLLTMLLFRPPTSRRNWDLVTGAELRQASVREVVVHSDLGDGLGPHSLIERLACDDNWVGGHDREY